MIFELQMSNPCWFIGCQTKEPPLSTKLEIHDEDLILEHFRDQKVNLKLNFRFIIPLEWTLCELQQAQKHAWRRQLAPTSAGSKTRCRSCHETKISQKWDIPVQSSKAAGYPGPKRDIYRLGTISLSLGRDNPKARYLALMRDIVVDRQVRFPDG